MAGDDLDADQALATFARIEVSDLPGVERPVAQCPDPAGRIVVIFPSGTRLRIDGSGSAAYRPVSMPLEFSPKVGVRPSDRTGSSRSFDHLPGVLVLELLRAEIAER
ncbi:hypothetical protein [Mesorhizobium sp. M0643]|uniref:hypothetical protein n=1 Tax=Mesorhizobium sp. M0643 TaxID=2956978 RepID=UPI00333D3981